MMEPIRERTAIHGEQSNHPNTATHVPILPGAYLQPCPELLTDEEAIRYLRLDTIDGLKNPKESLARYRASGMLRGTQVSKRVFYRRIELDRFLDRLTIENPR